MPNKKTVTGVLNELIGLERNLVSRARGGSKNGGRLERLRHQLRETQKMLLLTESVRATMMVRLKSFRSSIESETGLTEPGFPESNPLLELIFEVATAAGIAAAKTAFGVK